MLTFFIIYMVHILLYVFFLNYSVHQLNSMGFLGSWNGRCLCTNMLVKCETNRSYWNTGSCYTCIFTVTYMSPTKMVTVKQTHPMFLHAKRDTTTWNKSHNYTSLKLFLFFVFCYKRWGELLSYFRVTLWEIEKKKLQLQWKHLKYCIVYCIVNCHYNILHAIFHVLPCQCSLLQGIIIWE